MSHICPRRACMDKPTWLQTLAKLYTNYDTHLVSVYPLRRIGMISQLYTNQNNCGSTMPPSHGTVDCKAHPVPFEKAPKTHVLPEIMFGLGLPDWKLSHTFVTQIVGSTPISIQIHFVTKQRHGTSCPTRAHVERFCPAPSNVCCPVLKVAMGSAPPKKATTCEFQLLWTSEGLSAKDRFFITLNKWYFQHGNIFINL